MTLRVRSCYRQKDHGGMPRASPARSRLTHGNSDMKDEDNPAFLLSLRSASRPKAAALSQRRAAGADSHDQYRVLGEIASRAEGAAVYRRADDDSARAARRRARYGELDLARVRPAGRRLAHDRDVRQVGVKPSCTINGMTMTERRRIVDACNERGWELVPHNWAQNDLAGLLRRTTRKKSAP